MRVVLDTNLVVRAASTRQGLARELLRQILSDAHVLLWSHSLHAETRRVLAYPRLKALHRLDDAAIEKFLQIIVDGSELITLPPLPVAPLVGLDPTDDIVILTAIAGAADLIGSNNRHLFQPAVVTTAAQFGIRILRDRELAAVLRTSP